MKHVIYALQWILNMNFFNFPIFNVFVNAFDKHYFLFNEYRYIPLVIDHFDYIFLLF